MGVGFIWMTNQRMRGSRAHAAAMSERNDRRLAGVGKGRDHGEEPRADGGDENPERVVAHRWPASAPAAVGRRVVSHTSAA